MNGNIVAEDDETVTILTGPPTLEEKKITKSTIEARRASSVSIMPASLLNTLDREQILDLLAYIMNGGNEDASAFK